ncbi:hypothetical protein ACIQAL_13040 [Pseudomonas sp. NPDC088368]|uniref:hypothetical protein n=1 Tax=Pseudomonas sp. NPDC088368 TaxID=3364453 RepID=UPI00382FB502
MPANTEYRMSPRVALELAGIVQFDPAKRVELLAEFLERNGEHNLIEFFSQFIGMANSVVANCAEMSDQVLIEECGVHPDRFTSVNMPTIIGACQGVVLASLCDPKGACHGCAYRLGSIANQSPIATSDAAYKAHDPKGFLCHAYMDETGEPRRACVGHAKANKQPRFDSATEEGNPL